MNIKLEMYRVFYYVAIIGSISGAAKELYISQPAVSQSIKHLEKRLGEKLFLRSSKGVKLTNEGEILFKYIEQAYGLIKAAENKFKEIHNLDEGEIKIGAGDTLCRYYLIPYLEAFHKEHPGIKIHITNRTTPETINLLKSGKVDFGVINLPIELDDSIVVEETLDIQDCFVAGPNYKFLSTNVISIKELLEYPIMMLEKGTSTRNNIENYAKEQGIVISPEIELGSIDLLIQFAKIGLGVSCVIKNFAEDELKEKSLYEIKLLEPLPKRKVGIITLKDVPLSMAASKFIDILHSRDDI